MRHAPGATDRVGDRRLNLEPLRIEATHEVAAEQCFAAEEMRATGDLQNETVRQIDPDQRRISITPIGDDGQQVLIGVGIGVRTAETGIHGARIGKRHADCEPKTRSMRVDGDKPQRGLDRCNDDKRLLTRRALTAREPIGREPSEPHREVAPG
jgi:hypothetical protein